MGETSKKGKSTSGKDNDGKSKNKSWNRKVEDAKKTTKTELNAFVKKAVQANLAKINKKRVLKASDDEKSVNAIDLSGFDYDDMDNLKIDSDDEVSVWNQGQNDKVVLQSEDEDDSIHSESEDSGINLVQINPYFLSSKISGDTRTLYDFQMESHVDKATEEFFAFDNDNIDNSLDEGL